MTPEVEKGTEQLFEVKQVEETLFTLIKQNDEVKIVIKDQIVSKHTFETFEQAENYINSKPYELIVIACYMYNNHINKLQNELTNQTSINN